jgi:hypothetical protein
MTDGPGIPPPPPPASSSNLISRVLGLVTNPAGEWRKIDGEATSLVKLVTTYTVILAAILPIAFLIGALIAGAASGGGFGTLILVAVIYYAFQVGVPIALAFIIDALAPSFASTKNATQAAKLAIYSSTPMHLAGIIFLLASSMFGGLQWLPILIGLGWGGFLLFLGLPILMRTPVDKAPAYAGVSVGAWAVLWVIAQVIINAIVWNMVMGAAYSAAAAAAARYGY